MSTTQDTLEYTVFLTDPVLVNTLQNTVFYQGIPAGVIFLSPTEAAAKYNAPLYDPAGQPSATPLPPFAAPGITSPWFLITAAAQYPRDEASGERDSGGFLGFFKSHHFFNWVGKFEWAAGAGVSPIAGETLQPMSQRRWVDGGEIVGGSSIGGEGGTGNGLAKVSRSASRHLQGFGYHFDSNSLQQTHTPVENGHAAAISQWERFYFRVHVYPNTAAAIWRSAGATSGNAGVEVGMLANGALIVTNIDSIGTRTILQTTPPIPVHVWKKIDVLFTYSATVPIFQLYVNGLLLADLSITQLSGLGGMQQGQNIASSSIGDPAGASKKMAIDYDDWIGGDLPASGSAASIYPSIDWNYGSRVALVGARGFASDNNVAWAGDWRATRQHHIAGNSTTGLVSTTASVRLSVTTDAVDEVDNVPGVQGIAAFLVALISNRGTTSGQLGYRFPPAGVVMAAITQTTALGGTRVFYNPTGVTTPTPLKGLELVHDKGADTTSSTVRALLAAVEVIGVFGPEDIAPAIVGGPAPPTAPDAAIGIHNAPYPHSPWAKGGGQAPTNPYVVYGATYVGNGTAQDLAFNAPIHLLWVRAVGGGGTGGFQWFSSQNGSHIAGAQTEEPNAPVEVLQDPAFVPGGADATQTQTLVRIVGSDADKNANGVTYAYLAISDPGERFLAAGAFKTYAQTVDVVEALDQAAFLPDSVFAQIEQDGNTTTGKLYFKGLGSSATNLSPLTAAEIAGLSKSPGALTIKTALANLSTACQIAYLGLRRDDGSADAGLPAVLQMATYTGDGSASRTVNFAPISGKRPLWAIVVGHNGTSIFRDHQHTGTTSTTFPNTSNASTGITGGGIDSISVGSALNANGVVYDVLVVPGDSAAGNGGFSPVGTFVPVDPTAPAGGPGTPYDTTIAIPDVLVPIDTDTPPVEPGGDSTDFGDQCVDASTVIINQALSHIGITKRVADIVNEQSEEAAAARLHYSDDLSATLRDFPWPFATRYAHLVRVGGTQAAPVNGDWVYSFRAPANMMFARRIVNPNGVRRAFDPNPIDFRMGSDADGPLVYTNQPSVIDGATDEPELEYTVRPTCAASSGDAQFRQALAWRHAASLALPLARDDKKATFCLQVYMSLINGAQTTTANEQQQDKEGDADWISGRG